MNSKNVCKFITSETDEKLKLINFVLERDKSLMRSGNVTPYYRALLFTDGNGKIRFDGQTFPISKGLLVFAFPDELYKIEEPENTEYIYINFEGGRAQMLLKRYGISKANRAFPKCESLIPLWKESISRAEEGDVDIISEAVLLFAFSRLSKNSTEKEDAVARAVEYLEENFMDTELSLVEVSSELGYNSKYLSHIFKEKMGMGFSEYLRTLRIRHAVLLFDHNIDSVKNVAILSGFSDPLYFSSVFKKEVGFSPKEYKERLKTTEQTDTKEAHAEDGNE